MTRVALRSAAPSRTRKRTWCLLLLIASFPALSAAGGMLGYRLNLSASEPLGLWQIRPLERSARVGDLVFVCPPQMADMVEARRRGYLHAGLCPGGYAPLIKVIVAISGQTINIGRVVRIDGLDLPQSLLMPQDGQGRLLRGFEGGRIPVGQVFLHSSFAGSFDSRYFGPVPSSGILGLAFEVLTYAP